MPGLKNTQTQFGLISRIFHWGMAFIVLGLLCVGFYMVEMGFSPRKLELYGLHKSFGLLVLFLGALRLIWRFKQMMPSALPSHHLWERILSKTIHGVLYLSLFVMPLSGWVMSSAGEFPISFFGLFEMPMIVGKDEQIFNAARAVHTVSAVLLVGAIGLHIAGALKHHVLDRDETLRRMGGNLFYGVIGLGFLAIAAIFFLSGQDILKVQEQTDSRVAVSQDAVAEPADENPDRVAQVEVQNWVIDPKESVIDFEFKQYGQYVSGRFENWNAEIVFDPENLEHSAARVEIDVTSLKTGSADRDAQARGAEWFAADEYPQAVFESESFQRIDSDHYTVDGSLTLRGVQLPVSFAFILTFEDLGQGQRAALMHARFSLERLAFGIGQGPWKATDAIADAVEISLSLRAFSE